MANKKTRALTDEEFERVIHQIKSGHTAEGRMVKGNRRVAIALIIQANLGLRIGDIVRLRLDDIVKDGERYRLNIKEEKTGKLRGFTVPTEIYTYLLDYAIKEGIKPHQRLFDLSVRQIQKVLKLACDSLNLKGIGTHSFRKYFATKIYQENDFNIALVRTLLQHASVSTTQRYIGIGAKEVEEALSRHIHLPA